jgi:hypothetical protein
VERKKESGEEVNEAEAQVAAAAMGYGAVKYADLKNSRLTNYRWGVLGARLALALAAGAPRRAGGWGCGREQPAGSCARPPGLGSSQLAERQQQRRRLAPRHRNRNRCLSPCARARRFSFDDMLSLKGNTAVYLQYAHARIAGIVRKADRDLGEPRAAPAPAAPAPAAPAPAAPAPVPLGAALHVHAAPALRTLRQRTAMDRQLRR